MGKFLVFLFIIGTYSFASKADIKILNPRAEAMGSTGMIFGKIYGSLYLSPTAYAFSDKFSTGGISIEGYRYSNETFGGSSSINLKIGNLKLGVSSFIKGSTSFAFLSSDSAECAIYIPVPYVKRVKNFNIGVGFKLIHHISIDTNNHKSNSEPYYQISNIVPSNKKFNNINTNYVSFHQPNIVYGSYTENSTSSAFYLTPDIGLSYENYIGSFIISLSNLRSLLKDNNSNLISNLRLGYGKEFKIGRIIDSFKTALELNNLLMQGDKIDYSILRNICLGFELSTNLGDVILIDGRFGLKNLFPTYGFRLSISNILVFEYAFTNEDPGKEWAKNRRKINIFSFSIGSFE